MERMVTFVGMDEEFALFVTPSWSDNGEVYEIWVRKSDWTVRCSCFGASRWKKVGRPQDPDLSDCCKHERVVCDIIKRHLENE